MTDEEINEYNRLVERYKVLVAENSALAAELDAGIENCYIVADNMLSVGRTVTQNVKYVSGEISGAYETVEKLHKCLIDVTEHYFLFKNMSEASKKLTQYNDEYYTKFKFYNELRRITLGYVIGIDSHIVSSEALRKKVEKAYLANTDYWLAYAISAVMLWASDEKKAAYRAMNKALSMDGYKSCVFFMLVNIRFKRLEAAKNWYITLLDKTDVNNMSDEWQHVLHAFLIGAMSNDKEFTDLATTYFRRMIDQAEATNVDFNKKVIESAVQYAQSYIYVTERELITLKEVCPEYKEIKALLSSMEKICVMAQHYDEVYQTEDDEANDMFERVENILYDLINQYDDSEFEVIKGLKLNEAILSANGDMEIANAKFAERYGEMRKNRTFADLMLKWAFDEDLRETNITIKKFALSYLKGRISKGICSYFESQRSSLKEKYTLNLGTSGGLLPECQLVCSENDYDSAKEVITKYYNKNKTKYIMSDKYFKIFLLVCAASLVLLGVSALTVGTTVFPVFITLGITVGIVGGFLVWRRWVDLGKEVAEKCRLSLLKVKNALGEIGAFKKRVNKEFQALQDLKDAIDRF